MTSYDVYLNRPDAVVYVEGIPYFRPEVPKENRFFIRHLKSAQVTGVAPYLEDDRHTLIRYADAWYIAQASFKDWWAFLRDRWREQEPPTYIIPNSSGTSTSYLYY